MAALNPGTFLNFRQMKGNLRGIAVIGKSAETKATRPKRH